MIRVGVFGAAGRMGSTVCRAVVADDELDLVAAVDPSAAGTDLASVASVASTELVVASGAEAMEEAGVEVAVDFTVAAAALENLRYCAATGIHAVVGTTGLTEEDLGEIGAHFSGSSGNCVVAPNFAVGAVLMAHCAAVAAAWMDSAEIVELHHDAKVDAPSGTSLWTAGAMVKARRDAGKCPFPADRTARTVVEGARGGDVGGVRVHSVRLPGLLAHQEVVLGSPGESLTVRHDSFDRVSFMPGVVLAVKQVSDLPGLTVGLESLLGL